jgi:hypothetical protein
VIEIMPLEQLHDDKEPFLIHRYIKDSDDVGVTQCGKGIGLTPQFFKFRIFIVGLCRRKKPLDRHPAFELRIIRSVDGTFAASTQFIVYFVTLL